MFYYDNSNAVLNSILRRIHLLHADLIKEYGIHNVEEAAQDVALGVGDVEEIGSSDVSNWVKNVKELLHRHYSNLEENKKNTDPCWSNYRQIGMKMKNGKKVPNCVPKKEISEDNYLSSNNHTEITEFEGNRIPHSSWPGVTYHGSDIFKTVYADRTPRDISQAESNLHDLATNSSNNDYFDFQECYLGYSPASDLFVMGYDGWIGDDNCSPAILFRIQPGDHPQIRVLFNKIERDMSSHGNLWYDPDGGLKNARKKFPDLIDIRLD